MQYRPEIDGLRAIAVTSVILFHAGIPGLSGGFVGVDIFFVISGYLITTIIVNDLTNGTFSIARFYERRVRRILPALVVTALACLPFAWLIMLPNEMERFAKSLIGLSLFVSNFVFLQERGYFDLSSEEKPLLHTWSLAVEEQYYIVFPIFMILMWRYRKNWVLIAIVGLGVLSLLSSEALSHFKPGANFYLIFTRAWELLAGSIVALLLVRRDVTQNNMLAALGLVMVLAAIFFFDHYTRFPSLYGVLPILGVALVILYGQQSTWVARLLGFAPFVGIGLVSYSAYLFHQPIFAFTKLWADEPIGLFTTAFLILIVFSLAYLSWRFLEQPFRKSNAKTGVVLWAGAGSLLVLGGIGIAILSLERNTYYQLAHPEFVDDYKLANPWSSDACPELDPDTPLHGRCKTSGVEDDAFHVVFWGDSHGGRLRRATPEIPGVRITHVVHAGCPPLIGMSRYDGLGSSRNCDNGDVLRSYGRQLPQLNPDLIILVGRWSLYLNGFQRNGVLQPEHHYLDFYDRRATTLAGQQDLMRQALRETTDAFAPVPVLILDQPTEFAFMKAQNLRRMTSIPVADTQAYNQARAPVLDQFQEAVIPTAQIFCDAQNCEIRRDNILLYSDDNHMTERGSELIWSEILRPLIERRASAQ